MELVLDAAEADGKVSAGAVPEPCADEFTVALNALERHYLNSSTQRDFKHLLAKERMGRAFTLAGFGLALVHPLLGAVGFCVGLLSRWLLAHHVLHGGYDRVPGIPKRYTSRGFAQGHRRWLDWFDWIPPQAWSHEHNLLHHYYTNEVKDPDLLEANARLMRGWRIPVFLKWSALFLIACTWKLTYYSVNVLNHLEAKAGGSKPIKPITLTNFYDLRLPLVRKWIRVCILPYFSVHFVVLPLLFLPLGWWAVGSVFWARVLGELLHNLHMFLVIVPNHAGEDVTRFEGRFQGRGEFYRRQILGTANYQCGNEWLDYSQMWLNYQIEHHLFPRLTMLQYREVQPKVKALCAEHGLPYIQENLFRRVVKMVAISTGKASMVRSQEG